MSYKTREVFFTFRNDCNELVYQCLACYAKFEEHDGDMISDRDLKDHIEECPCLPTFPKDDRLIGFRLTNGFDDSREFIHIDRLERLVNLRYDFDYEGEWKEMLEYAE